MQGEAEPGLRVSTLVPRLASARVSPSPIDENQGVWMRKGGARVQGVAAMFAGPQ